MKAGIDKDAYRKMDFDIRTGRQRNRCKFLGITLQLVNPEPFGSPFGNRYVALSLSLKDLDIPLYYFSLQRKEDQQREAQPAKK